MNEDELKISNNIIQKRFDKFVELFKNRKIDEIKKYDLNQLYLKGKIYLDIKHILDVFDYLDSKNYKYQNDFKYYEYLSNLFKEYELKNFNYLLIRLCRTKNGNYLLHDLSKLNKFKNDFDNKNKVIEYLEITSKLGTLPNFIFWERYYKKINISCKCLGNRVLISAISNSDDRIFKYILKNKENYLIDDKQKNFYLNISESLFCNIIPNKYILRRLKFLSNYFDFSTSINYFLIHVSNLKIFFKILKFYYNKNVKIFNFSNVVGLIIFNYKFNYIDEIINVLKTDFEKDHFVLSFVVNFMKFKSNDYDKFLLLDTFELKTDCFEILNVYYIDFLTYLETNKLYFNSKIVKDILLKMKRHFLVNKYLLKKYSNLSKKKVMNNYYSSCKNAFRLIPYFFYLEVSEKDYFLIQLNRILHNFKVYIRKVNNIRYLTRKTYYYNLLKEVKSFKPNPKKKILMNGSMRFILSKQSFNYKPPYHLHFNEIYTFDNFLIREKADGILVKRLPIETSPSCSNIKNYRIKAEFIEELDLYLIFDIDIPNMSIKDRYNFLRDCHHLTKNNKLKVVNNYEDLKEEIIKERKLLDKFLKQDYDCYRWYPKASWEIYNTSDYIKKDLIDNVILENDLNFICDNGNYKNDGLIIVPLNGLNEIKIKPKSLMTIDLLIKDDRYFDSDGNDWAYIIHKKDDYSEYNNNICRFYPLDNGLYQPREIRFDKKLPNNYKVVVKTIKFYKSNWRKNINKIYYERKFFKFNKEWKNIIRNQDFNLKRMISNMCPLDNSRWLDLGCGKGKLLNIIKKTNPKSYLGLDNDLDVIINSIHRYSNDLDSKLLFNVNFVKTDLNDEWNKGDYNWYKINYDIKMDYIVSNFSLMYFCNDSFWKNINRISRNGTKMLLNLVNDKSSQKLKFNDSYIYKRKDKVKYFFSHIHNQEKEEEFISETKLNNFLNEYKWKIKQKYIPNGSFESYYSWYIIERY